MVNMKSLALLVLCVASLALATIETEDDVLVITKANFKEALEQHDYILVEFCKYFYAVSLIRAILSIYTFDSWLQPRVFLEVCDVAGSAFFKDKFYFLSRSLFCLYQTMICCASLSLFQMLHHALRTFAHVIEFFFAGYQWFLLFTSSSK